MCGAAGAGCALLEGVDFTFIFTGIAGLAGVVVAALILGATGCLVLAPAVMAFLFMNRFDESWAIPLGHNVSISVVFMCLCLCVTALTLHVLGRSDRPLKEKGLSTFPQWYFMLWVLFVVLGAFSILINQLTDVYVQTRYLPGEVLSLISIALPALFVLLIPLSALPYRRTIWCLRAFIGLAALAGLIMTMFGLLPEHVMSSLGWTHATGGTLDLVRGRLPLGHPNRVAATLLMVLPVTVMLGLGDKQTFWRMAYLGAALLLFCGILFSLSRSALLNTVVLLGLTLAHYFFGRKEKRLMGIVLACSFGVLLAAAAVYLFAHHDFSRFWSKGYYEEASVERRGDSLRTALRVWADHPLWGVGPDSVYPRFSLRPGWTPTIQDAISPIIFYRGHPTAETPHNFYLHVLAEFGILGSAFFFSLLFLIARAFRRVRRLPALTLEERETVTGLYYGVIAVLLVGFFEAVLMAGIRPNIVIWVFWGLGLRYVFLVADEAGKQTEPPPDIRASAALSDTETASSSAGSVA